MEEPASVASAGCVPLQCVPAVFRDLRSLACRFGKLFGWTPLERTTPWAFIGVLVPKWPGLLSELWHSDSSRRKTHKITMKPNMLESDTLFVFSLFVAFAYLENYEARSGERVGVPEPVCIVLT